MDPLGFVVAGRSDASEGPEGRICPIGAAPRLRRRALGSRLLSAIEEWLRELGARTDQVRIPHGNPRVMTFFRKWGYTVDHVLAGFYAHRRDAVVLWKRLSRDQISSRSGSLPVTVDSQGPRGGRV